MPPRKRAPAPPAEVIDLTGEGEEEEGEQEVARTKKRAAPHPRSTQPPQRRQPPAVAERAAAEGPSASASPPRKRGSKKGGGAEKEARMNAAGRPVKWSSRPAQPVVERMGRALPGSGHRLFLLDRKVLAPVGARGGAAEEFAVLGATGNVYSVRVGARPKCSCPDHARVRRDGRRVGGTMRA